MQAASLAVSTRVATLLLASTAILSCGGGGSSSGGGGSTGTTVTVTNKISSIGAGEYYLFNSDFHHTQGTGVSWAITSPANGGGTLLASNAAGGYIAPSTPPGSSNGQVTLTVTANNGSGASDSDTFKITAASGPFVTITPNNFTVTAGGDPKELAVTVSNDTCTMPGGCLSSFVASAPACGTSGSSVPCGSLSAFSGTPGSGHYTVLYTPPANVPSGPVLPVLINIGSVLPNACVNHANVMPLCPGNAIITINAGP